LWESIGISGLINDSILEDRAGSAVLEHLLKREDNHLVGMPNTGMKETIAVACWYLWWLRRRITNNESTPSIYNCKMSIFSIVANAAKATVAGGMNQNVKWTRPQIRYIKLNVDASFYVDRKEGATAAVLRDFQGRFLAAAGRFIPHVNSAAMAEVMAMKDGLNLANQLGCSRIEAESDSLETIEGCTGGDTWWSENSAIFADCLDIRAGFDDVKFKHCSREANKVADEIARLCFQSGNSCNWIDEPPSFILQTLIDDVTII
jgi:ribonuclease HI